MRKKILTELTVEEIRNLFRGEIEQALANYNMNKNRKEKRTSILNFEEGCKYIGISKSHGYKLTSQGRIPHSKQGKRIFFEKEELDQWLLENKVKGLKEREAEVERYINQKGINYGK